ncbi:porin [Sulfurimonas sp. HSL-1716]|uniref:porin n=1 Tax=Hydrocurvibacter sulfurireducens TaxID=3131937 RepID=UPI0031F8E311
MKIVKMSLAAALLVGASAFAIDNVKVSGDVQVFYSTNDMTPSNSGVSGVGLAKTGTSGSLFDKETSAADAGVHLNASADLVKNDLVSVSTGAAFTALSTLGLENNFVSNVWGSSHAATVGNGSGYGAKVENSSWFNEAWIAATLDKTTVKVGRMELDTPLAFTETWSIERNSFEAAVVINQNIPDTTLVGAYVGNGNGNDNSKTVSSAGLAVGAVVNQNGEFKTYGTDGAYAAGIINNSYKPLTAQAWYYDVSKYAQAYWLQADFSMNGVMAGAQYSAVKADASGSKEDNVYALMLGYAMKDKFTVKASYSSVNDDGSVGKAGYNTATADAQSKLYTEAWWNYGYVSATGTNSYNITLEVPVKNVADFGVYYTNADQSAKGATNAGNAVQHDLSEITLTATRSFGPLDATLAYSNIDAKNQNIKAGHTKGSAYSQVQAYLTLNF